MQDMVLMVVLVVDYMVLDMVEILDPVFSNVKRGYFTREIQEIGDPDIGEIVTGDVQPIREMVHVPLVMLSTF